MTGAGAVLWTADDVRTAAGGRASAAADWTAEGVSIDSRTVQPGDLFVAIAGPNFDGHDFTGAAFEAGASAAIVSHVPDGVPTDAPLIVVEDTLGALWDLGAAGRRRMNGRVAGVTGSVGKTGTKDALQASLSRFAPTHASAASHNNHWGVPLSLARMPRDASFAVFEIGMNHAGEIERLSRLVRPHLAIITTVEPVHLEFFESVVAIADAKAEIFAGLEADGVAILNRDNAHFDRLAARAQASGVREVISFGARDDADARLVRAVSHPHCSCLSADICGQAMTYKVGVPGPHWVSNSLAVLAAVKALGGDLGLAGLALGELAAGAGRGQRRQVVWPGGSVEIIDESYNANPASMGAAVALLDAAEPRPRGRRIAVLGDMLELGRDASRLHGELADTLAASATDLVFAAGPEMAHLFANLPGELRGSHAVDSESLIPDVLANVRAGDVVMVKGSLGSRMGILVAVLAEAHAASVRPNGTHA
jgi:UDP-N-acetylmuramoyl-tripeptide--D-alanyl-D-alanine ligase